MFLPQKQAHLLPSGFSYRLKSCYCNQITDMIGLEQQVETLSYITNVNQVTAFRRFTLCSSLSSSRMKIRLHVTFVATLLQSTIQVLQHQFADNKPTSENYSTQTRKNQVCIANNISLILLNISIPRKITITTTNTIM